MSLLNIYWRNWKCKERKNKMAYIFNKLKEAQCLLSNLYHKVFLLTFISNYKIKENIQKSFSFAFWNKSKILKTFFFLDRFLFFFYMIIMYIISTRLIVNMVQQSEIMCYTSCSKILMFARIYSFNMTTLILTKTRKR